MGTQTSSRFITTLKGYAAKLINESFKMSSFNEDHIVYYRLQVTSKKEVGLFQASESIVMGGEKHRLNFRENFKRNWKNPQTSVHSLLK